MLNWSPKCYRPSFVEIGPPVPEKKFFNPFLPYRGVAVILVMSPVSCHQIFISLYLKAFIQSLVQIVTVVSEEIQLKFLYVHEEMTLTFNTHVSPFIKLADPTNFQVTGCDSF